MSRERIDQHLVAVEAALASLTPAAAGVDRDRLMYLAGRASAGASATPRRRPRNDWLWPCLAAASALVAACFGAMLLLPDEPQVVKETIYVQRDQPVGRSPSPERKIAIAAEPKAWGAEYLRMRRLVLTEGADALPSPAPASAGDVSIPGWDTGYRDAVKQLLDG